MAVRPIRLFPAPELSEPCDPIKDFDQALRQLIEDLWDTLYHSPGVGLAAPQIGISKQVSVIDTKRSFNKRTREAASRHQIVLINPAIEHTEGVQVPREGCLSVPDWLANVQRFERVVVRYRTPEGGEEEVDGRGFEALALQHEVDHLRGKLFIDRVVNLKTDLFRRKTYGKHNT